MAAAEPQIALADMVVAETMLFFKAFDEMERGTLALEVVDEGIDRLAFGIQALDVARSAPDHWQEISPGRISSYEYLWPCEQVMLFLLANYAALHAASNRGVDCPLISPASLAWEILSLEWLPHEMASETLLGEFLAHPASQAPRG